MDAEAAAFTLLYNFSMFWLLVFYLCMSVILLPEIGTYIHTHSFCCVVNTAFSHAALYRTTRSAYIALLIPAFS